MCLAQDNACISFRQVIPFNGPILPVNYVIAENVNDKKCKHFRVKIDSMIKDKTNGDKQEKEKNLM